MKRTRTIITSNLSKFPHFEEYFKLLDVIEQHEETNPDISIETCKALIEGVSKTILIALDVTRSKEVIDKDDLPQLYRTLSKVLAEKCSDLEGDFVERFGQIIRVIGEIRNKRSDISHGRMAPKFIYSSPKFATTIATMVDGLMEYILEHYFGLEFPDETSLKYDTEDLAGYNQWLDESLDFPIKKALYSRLLFENDYDEYEQRYFDEYLPSLDDSLKDDGAVIQPEIQLESIIPIRYEQVDSPMHMFFDSGTESKYTDQKYNAALRKFSNKWKVDVELLEELYEHYYFSEKEPTRDELIGILRTKPKLKERATVAIRLGKAFLELAEFLNILRSK